MIARALRSLLIRYSDERWIRPAEWWQRHRIQGQIVIVLHEHFYPLRLRLRERVRVKEAHFLRGVVVDVQPDGLVGLISFDGRGAAPYLASEMEAETPCNCLHCKIDGKSDPPPKPN